MSAIPVSKRYAIPQYHPCDAHLPHPNLSRYFCPLPTNQFIQWDGIMRINAANSNWNRNSNSADRDHYRSSSAKQRNSSKPGNTPILTVILLPRAVCSPSTYPMRMGLLFSRSWTFTYIYLSIGNKWERNLPARILPCTFSPQLYDVFYYWLICCTNTNFRRRCSSGRSLNLVGFWLVIENICTGGIADAIADADAFYRFVDIRIELMRSQYFNASNK